MTIWVDADAAPNACKAILTRAAKTRDVDVVLVAARWMRDPKSDRVTTRTVGQGEDAADDHIVDKCEPGDLVVTFDIPLAARAVDEGATVITPHGAELDEENVRSRLSQRDFGHYLRSLGIDTGGPSAFGEPQKCAFANALDRWLTSKDK